MMNSVLLCAKQVNIAPQLLQNIYEKFYVQNFHRCPCKVEKIRVLEYQLI